MIHKGVLFFIVPIIFFCIIWFSLKETLIIPTASFSQAKKTCVKNNITLGSTRLIFADKDEIENSCIYYDNQNGLFSPNTLRPRFIITGGAGFVGSSLVKHLRKEFDSSQIKIVDNLWRGHLSNLQYDNGSWSIVPSRDFCHIDLRNAEQALKYIRGADYIYHLADIVAGVEYVFGHQDQVFRDNILINTNTLHAVRQNQIPNYIYVGTACSFPKHLQEGPGIHALREDQTYPAEPESGYGWSKLMGEYEATLAQDLGLNVGILRFHNVYGPRSDFSEKSGQAIPSLIRKAINYPVEPFKVWGSGNQYRDFVYIDDVVNALDLVRKKGMNMGVIQIGSGKATTIKDLANHLAALSKKKLNKTLLIQYDTSKPEGDQGRIAVNDRAREIIGWSPKTSIDVGLGKTLQWMLDSKKNLKILYIVIGQPRGTDLAWKSLHKYVLSKMNAHLATFFTKKYPQTTILHQMAQFNWNAEEYDDWGIVFDRAAKTCSPDSAAADWRQLCKIPDQWLGSIKNCGHPASAGILWSFRWLVQQKLALLNLEDKYDVFILSRADELFLCDHYNFSQFNKSVGYLPEGEEYGGYSDRHLAGNFDIWNKMINITKNIVCNPEKMRESLFKWKPGSGFNMESVQKAMWDEWGLEITSFPRTMFTVRGPEDPTQWSTGEAHEILSKFKLKVKYQGEMDATLRNCNSDLKKTLDDIDSHEWYKYFPIQ